MKKLAIAILSALVASGASADDEIAFSKQERNVMAAMIADDWEAFSDGGNSLLDKFLKSKGITFVKTNALQYAIDYQRNEIKANRSYKGKQLLVTNCFVKKISAGLFDQPIIACQTNNQFLDVQLNFPDTDDAIEEASGIQRGTQLDFVCTGDGEIAGMPIAKDCRLATTIIGGYYKDISAEIMRGKGFFGPIPAVLAIKVAHNLTPEESEQCNDANSCYTLFSEKGREILERNGGFADLSDIKGRMDELGISEEFQKFKERESSKKPQ